MLEQLLSAERTGKRDLLRENEYLAREKGPGDASIELGQAVFSTLSALLGMVLAYRAKSEGDRLFDREVNAIISGSKASPLWKSPSLSIVPSRRNGGTCPPEEAVFRRSALDVLSPEI